MGLLSPLLQKLEDNPCATLITNYMNAVEELCKADYASTRNDITKIFQYMPKPTIMPRLDGGSPWMVTAMASVHCVRDGNKCFNR